MLKIVRLTSTICRLNEHIFYNIKKKCNNNNKCSFILNNLIKKYSTESAKRSVVHLNGLREDVNVEELTNNDEELLKKLQVIILEVDVMRQEGLKVPSLDFMKQQHWHELLLKTSRSQRKKFLEFLFKVEKKRENEQIRKMEAKAERDNRPDYVDDGHIRYGLNHNTFLLRIYESTINHMYNAKLISAAQFGQPLIIDCGYDSHMTMRECQNCAKQIMLAFAENRNHDEPFDLHLCNADPTSPTLTALQKFITTLYEPWFPLNVHHQSYLDTKFQNVDFKTNPKLVYLTPHCREELKEFDPNAIYIIGGIVDLLNQEPLSLARAKTEGLKMARLPLDRYLHWGGGSGKNLTVNQMVSILLDLKRSGEWDFALRHVPRRKVVSETKTLRRFSEKFAPSYDRTRTFDNLKQKSNINTKKIIQELLNR